MQPQDRELSKQRDRFEGAERIRVFLSGDGDDDDGDVSEIRETLSVNGLALMIRI